MALTLQERRNIQGVGLAGFRKDYQEFIFIRFDDADAARTLIHRLAPRVASAWEVRTFNILFSEIRHRTDLEGVVEATWASLMISAKGLEKIGVDLSSLPNNEGASAFRAGMANRSQQIGDTRASDDPNSWELPFRPGQGVDALVLIASDSEEDLEDLVADVGEWVSAAGCSVAYQERGQTLPEPLTGHEHFGFKDGVSQPSVKEWDRAPTGDQPPAVALGEFVLGYPDETGSPTAVPDPWRDGSFAVYRRLRQDVTAFRKQAASEIPGADPTLSTEQLAAKMVGRWPSGTPVEVGSDTDPGSSGVTNSFKYKEDPYDDDEGQKTPRWGHIRKANPRDETRPDPDDSVQRHRMIRRGIPFGQPLPARATEDDSTERGIHFLAIVADLDRQFEFVQRKWMNDPNFPTGQAPATTTDPYNPPPPGTPADGPDPISGEHDAGAELTLHQASGVHPFAIGEEVIQVTAGEYFFVPSISALHQLGEGAGTGQAGTASETPMP